MTFSKPAFHGLHRAYREDLLRIYFRFECLLSVATLMLKYSLPLHTKGFLGRLALAPAKNNTPKWCLPFWEKTWAYGRFCEGSRDIHASLLCKKKSRQPRQKYIYNTPSSSFFLLRSRRQRTLETGDSFVTFQTVIRCRCSFRVRLSPRHNGTRKKRVRFNQWVLQQKK